MILEIELKHPFKIGMSADDAVEIIEQRKIFRVAKNEIVGLESNRYAVKWHLEPCSLLIKFDFQNGGYYIFEILKPLQTNKRLTVKQAMPTPNEIERVVQKLKQRLN